MRPSGKPKRRDSAEDDFWVGCCLRSLGRLQKAVAEYKEAIR